MEISWVTAFWLGIMTSISPCPLATNIAAISYISKEVEHTSEIIRSGLGYVLGRTVVYVVLAALVTYGLLSIPGASQFLQKYMNRMLGPILIVVALVLLGWLSFSLPSLKLDPARSSWLMKHQWQYSVMLGMLFALSFCPVSAALYFGSLIPLSVEQQSLFVLPGLYGIGTAAPTVIFAIAIGVGTHHVGRWFNRMAVFDRYIRALAGWIFLMAGIYLILSAWFGIDVLSMLWSAE